MGREHQNPVQPRDSWIKPQDYVPVLLQGQRGNYKAASGPQILEFGENFVPKKMQVFLAELSGFPRQVSPCPETKACMCLGRGSPRKTELPQKTVLGHGTGASPSPE